MTLFERSVLSCLSSPQTYLQIARTLGDAAAHAGNVNRALLTLERSGHVQRHGRVLFEGCAMHEWIRTERGALVVGTHQPALFEE